MGILEIIAIILVVGWVLGLGFGITTGLLHLLLVVAVVIVLFRLITGAYNPRI